MVMSGFKLEISSQGSSFRTSKEDLIKFWIWIFLVKSKEALSVINRPALMNWLNRLRLPDGSFMMHERDGEVDIRGVYCALSVARLTNVYTQGIDHLLNHYILQAAMCSTAL